MDYTVHGNIQVRILEWKGSSQPRDGTQGWNPGMEPRDGTQGWNPGMEPRSSASQEDSLPTESQGKPKNTEVGSLSLLQRISLTQESNWGPLHCRQILYQLSYEGSPLYLHRHAKKIAKRNILYFNQVVLNWGQFCSPPPQGTFDNSWRYFWLSQKEAWALLASSGQRPGMLPNMTQCTG